MAYKRGSRVEGVNRLKAALEGLREAASDPAALEATAKEIQKRTRRRVDVVTHELQRRTVVQPPESGLNHKGISVSVGWIDPRVRRYVWMEEYGTSKRPANPALTLAVESARAMYHKRIIKQLEDGAKK